MDARWQPPVPALPPERRWAFVRAFGPPEARLAGAFDGAAAARTALALDLGARIGARVSLQRLSDELGRAPALLVFQAHARAAERARALLDLARELAALAAAERVPLVFLKGVALLLGGASAPERRPVGDVDVLVPSSQAQALARALRARGFRDADAPDRPHQLRPLIDPAGRVLELHGYVPGLRVHGGAATFETLRAAGICRRLAELPGDAHLPAAPLLAAHAVAHGIVQSGHAPQAYSLTRLLGDAFDLGLERDDDLARRAFALLDGNVTATEWEALRELARALGSGQMAPFEEAARPDVARPAATLLRHVVAAALDEDYRLTLRAAGALAGRGPRARLRAVRAALSLSNAQIDALYGRPRAPWGYAWRRLLRPLDLGLRFARARAARRRLRAS